MGKAERIDLRVEGELKQEFAAAAELAGMNLSSFLVAAAREQASRMLRTREAVVLSDTDRDRFLDALEEPPRPIPPALKKAVEQSTLVEE